MVSADVVASGQITLQGIVPPLRCLIVNNKNQIIEVTSNTASNVIPTVYRNKISASNEVSLTPSLEQEYEMIGHQSDLQRIGIVYQRSSTTLVVKKSLPLFLSILTWHNYDYLMSSIFSHELQLHFNL